jgi:hypothetical protein
LKIPAAFDRESHIVFPHRVNKKDHGPFTCLECKEHLILRTSKLKRPHFAHFRKTQCIGYGESQFHLLAKELVVSPHLRSVSSIDGSTYMFPFSIIFASPTGIFASKLPTGCRRCVEVFHTHRVDPVKRDFLFASSLPFFEVVAKQVLQAWEQKSPLLYLTPPCSHCADKRKKRLCPDCGTDCGIQPCHNCGQRLRTCILNCCRGYCASCDVERYDLELKALEQQKKAQETKTLLAVSRLVKWWKRKLLSRVSWIRRKIHQERDKRAKHETAIKAEHERKIQREQKWSKLLDEIVLQVPPRDSNEARRCGAIWNGEVWTVDSIAVLSKCLQWVPHEVDLPRMIQLKLIALKTVKRSSTNSRSTWKPPGQLASFCTVNDDTLEQFSHQSS